MGKLSVKNKIYLAAFFWLMLCASMFGYFFRILDRSTEDVITTVNFKQKQLQQVRIEEDSFKQAKSDLAKLKAQPLQPEDFFSKDITLVNEFQTLEALSQKLNVTMAISGIGGTVNTVPRTKIQGVILYVPYSMIVTGSFNDVLGFIESLENLSFVTNITTLTLGGAGGSNVTASFTASFYLKQ